MCTSRGTMINKKKMEHRISYYRLEAQLFSFIPRRCNKMYEVKDIKREADKTLFLEKQNK